MVDTKMAGSTPARTWRDLLPPSPLGATPRPHLRQHYPKPPEGSYVTEFELNRNVQSDHSKVKRTSTKSSYTSLRSHQNSLDTVDSRPPPDDDYAPSAAVGIGRNTKSVLIIALIFFLALLAVVMVFLGLGPKSKV